jgi:HSP20 family protein
MLTLWNAFDDLFNDQWARPVHYQAQREFRPAVDVSEGENHYLVTADVPGMKAEDLDITVDNNVLTVSGVRKLEKKDEKHGYHRVERHYGSFKRSFALPEGVDTEAIEANVENGSLGIRIPKPAVAQPRKVKVGAGTLTEKAKKLFTKPSTEETTAPAS